MRGLFLLILLAFGPAAVAEPALPTSSPGIAITAAGIFCAKGTTLRQDAPGTSLGYIQLLHGTPEIAFHQQEVPARLGVLFGVIVTADRDIPEVRNVTWKPGATTPEVWFANLSADVPKSRGFSFDFAEELVPGIWRMEGYEGDRLLYSVEFEVLPGSALPGVGSDCNLLS